MYVPTIDEMTKVSSQDFCDNIEVYCDRAEHGECFHITDCNDGKGMVFIPADMYTYLIASIGDHNVQDTI